VKTDQVRHLAGWLLLAAALVLVLAGFDAWTQADKTAAFGTAVNNATAAFGGPDYGQATADHSDAIVRFIAASVATVLGMLLLRTRTTDTGK